MLQLDVKDGSFPSLTECATDSTAVSSGPPWERPGQLVVLSSTVAGTLHSLLAFYRLFACPAPSAFILTLTERKKEWILLAKVQGSKMKLMGLAESVILTKSKMCLSAHREYEFPVGWSFTSFYLYTLCWPWCVLWESTIQVLLHVTSLVSPLLWDKSKYGAVPSTKCSLQFLFLPKRDHEEPRPGCLHQIAELGLPLIFRRERSEFRVQQTLQHVQSLTPDDFSKQWFVESLIFQSK